MRRIFIASVFLSVFALSATARGEEPTFPTFGELPIGSTTSPPRTRLERIPARESVPGFYIAVPKDMRGLAAARRVLVVGDAKRAVYLEKGTSSGGVDEPASACFAVDEREKRLEAGMSDKPVEWDQDLGSVANLWTRTAEIPMSGVAPVHMERVTVAADGLTATLDSVDAWVDPSSRGVRLIGKASLPLKHVGVAPNGGKIFAGREERGDRRRVQFVVMRPRDSLANQFGSTFVRRLEGDVIQNTDCAHIRVALAVTKEGDAALVSVPVVLPSLDGRPVPRPTELHGVRARRSSFQLPSSGGEPDMRELRLREAAIQLSVSQTSRDKEPVVSLSSRWISREQVQRVFVPPPTVE
jgi:hypothetical protein